MTGAAHIVAQHRSGVASTTVHGRRVVFDTGRRELFELRPDVAMVWPLLDGSTTLDQLAHELADAAQLTAAEAERQLSAVVQELTEADLITLIPSDR